MLGDRESPGEQGRCVRGEGRGGGHVLPSLAARETVCAVLPGGALLHVALTFPTLRRALRLPTAATVACYVYCIVLVLEYVCICGASVSLILRYYN